jgi:Major Facilitator Superfamily
VIRSLAPLRHRGFRRLATGQFASSVGDACYAVALPWYVLATHGGTLLLGTVLAAYGIPRTVALAFGGQASDRWRPWTVMMASDAVRVIAVAAMAAAAAAGPARAVVLVPIAVVLGAGEGFFLPGSFSIIPTLLPGDDLQQANALSSAGTQLAMLAGPAAGGALVAILGPAAAFALDAATFAVSAVTLADVRAAQRRPAAAVAAPPRALQFAAAGRTAEPAGTAPAAGPAGPKPTVAKPTASEPTASKQAAPDPAAGPGLPRPAEPTLRSLLRSERILQLMLLVTLAANLGLGGMSEVALPALAHGPLHAGAGGYGGLLVAFAGGALAGTLAASQLRGGRRPAILGSAAFIAESACLAAAPYLGGLLADGAALAAFGFLNGLGNVIMITLFQRWAPPELLGRIMGLLMLAAFGIFPVSVALGAVVVHVLGPAPFFPIAAAITAAAILAGLSQRSWRNLGAAGEPARTAAAATVAARTATGS